MYIDKIWKKYLNAVHELIEAKDLVPILTLEWIWYVFCCNKK